MALFRALVEIRYYGPLYMDNRGRIAERFKDRYSVLGFDIAPNPLQETLKLRDENRGLELFVHAQHCGGEMKFEPVDLEVFAEEVTQFCRPVLRDILRVDTLRRVGIRFLYRQPEISENVMNAVLEKLMPPKDDPSDIGFRHDNWRVRLESEDEHNKYTIQVYSEQVIEGEKQQPTGHLVLDVDVHRESQPTSVLSSLSANISAAEKDARALAERVLERIVDERVSA